MLAILVLIALVAFFMTLLFKLGPAYMGFWTIRSIMENVGTQAQSFEGGAREISMAIGRQLDVNGVSQVTTKDFVIRRADEGLYKVTLEYEQREHLFFNVDAVLTFTHQVDVRGR